MSSSSIGQSAGSVYVEIYGNNKPLARDLKQTDSLLHRHAAAMSGLQVFKPTLFTSQIAGIAAMARGSGVLHSQLNAMSNLAPKLGALVSPFQAMRTAMTGMQNVFNPGNVVKSAVAGQVKALEAAKKMQAELKKRIGYTPSGALAAIQNYKDDVDKARLSVGSSSVKQLEILAKPDALKKQIDELKKTTPSATGLTALKKDLESADSRKAEIAATIKQVETLQKLEAEYKVAETEYDKQEKALAKQREAIDKLTASEHALAKAEKEINSQIKGNAISPAEAKARLAPYVKAVHDAHAQVKSAQGTSKLDIMGGGAISSITNVISGVMSFGKIVFGVASSIFSVFKGIFNAVASVAHAIINVLGSAFTFLKNLAVHTFQIVSVAVLAVGTSMVAGLHHVFEKGKDLLNSYANTGIKVKDTVIIATAAEMSGVSAENITTEVQRMQHALSGIESESHKARYALTAMGLDIKKLQQMSPVDQLTAIAKGLSSITDPADRSAAAINIFTVRGHEMVGLLLQMAETLKLSKQQWGQAGDAFDKNKDKFAYIARSIEAVTKIKIPSFFAGIATPLVNTLSWLSDKLNKFDPFKYGFKIGTKIDEYLRLIIGAFQKGRLMEWLGLELKVAFLEAVNYLIAGLMVAGDVIAGIFNIDGFLPAIAKGLSGAFKIAVGVFLESFQAILPTMGAGIGWLVDKLIQGLKYAKNILIGGVIGSVVGGITGGLTAGPAGILPGVYAGRALGVGIAGYFGIPESNTHFQDKFRKEAIDVNTPARASGGPVTGGKPVLVGEKGPEIFVPHDSGEVISNNDLRHLADGTPGASEYSKHDWLAEAAARTAAAKTGGKRPVLGGVERGPAFPTVTISKLGIGAGVMTPTQDVKEVFASPEFEQAFHKMQEDEKLSFAQRLQKEGIADFGESVKLFGKSVPQLSAILAKSVSDHFHPNKNAEATKEQLVNERDALVAKQKKLLEQIENPPTRDYANEMLASVKKQIASKQAQIDSGDLSPSAEKQAEYDLSKLQKEEAYQQGKVNEQKAYNQSTGADAAKRREIKSLQRNINNKQKEIDNVQGLGPHDVMGVAVDRTRLTELRKKLIAQGLVSSNGKPFDVSDQPKPSKSSGFSGTMSGWSARRIGSFATGGMAKMEEYLKNIDNNTRGLTTGYGQ